jgi:protease PrsW
MSFFSLAGLSMAPGLAIALFIYLKDKYEREPANLLFLGFLYGVISAMLTLFFSWPLDYLFIANEFSLVDQFAKAFVFVALIEEFSKFVFVRFVLYYNKNFNEPFDGIVYAVMIGMGFASLENILYVFQYGISTGILRMFTAVPAHATFAILMGYYLGKAKFARKKQFLYSVAALMVPALFHGAYDYFWFISFIPGIWIGAVISLVVAVILSRKAIRLHQQSSPFAPAPK